MSKQKLKLIIISDGTGETGSAMARAALTQFENSDAYYTRFKNVRSREQIDAIFQEAALHHDMIVYTIVSVTLREYIAECSRRKHVRAVDLMGPILTAFSNFFHEEPADKPGLLHAVNDAYFNRVAAMEFTLNHDDGRNLESLHLADVILVGISRTSKTPLSIYLSLQGIKVVNVPIVCGTILPEEVFQIDQRKIVALTIDPKALQEIRLKRLSRLGAGQHQGDYAEMKQVVEEVEWASTIFKENKLWPVLDITGKAVEETASEIKKLLTMRKTNIFKQKNRFKEKG